VMGVINVTPDSFHPPSRTPDGATAKQRGIEQITAGADILDVGGESTRPGAVPVGAEEERRRVLPVIEALARRRALPLSIDTYRAEVARDAVSAGAVLINDVSGGLLDPAMADTAAGLGVAVIVGHLPDKPKSIAEVHERRAACPLARVVDELGERLRVFAAAGVARERLLVDPGVGFGKRVDDNLEILRNLRALAVFECPIVVGISRKRFLGAVMRRAGLSTTSGVPEMPRTAPAGEDHTPGAGGVIPPEALPDRTVAPPPGVVDGPEDRLLASLAAQVLAVAGGATLVRTHDVRETKMTLAIADAILH